MIFYGKLLWQLLWKRRKWRVKTGWIFLSLIKACVSVPQRIFWFFDIWAFLETLALVYFVLECQLNPGRRIFKDSLFTAGRVRIFVTNLWPTGRSNLASFMQSLPKRARYSTVRSPMPTWHYEPIAIRIWVTGTAVPPDRWFCIYIVKFNC